MIIDNPRCLLLNQVAGPLFRELSEDLAANFGHCILLSGDGYDEKWSPRLPLQVVTAPRYDRRNIVYRAVSWAAYFIAAFWMAIRVPQNTLLIIVSNPPFLSVIGWFMKVFRRQKYVVLVYDIYPGLLVKLGRLSESGLVTSMWHLLNKRTWESADMVLTIGDYMAANVRKTLAPESSTKIAVIPNWADGEFVRPINKKDNWFSRSLGQDDKLTVMYSGNLGHTHDVESMIEMAIRFRNRKEVGFVIIGEGEKREKLQSWIEAENLTNIILLPFQKECDLPYSLSIADLGVVSLQQGIEGYSVPSKTYYMMAAGAALLVISKGPNELTDLVDRFQCGFHVPQGDVNGLCKVVQDCLCNPENLQRAKTNSRSVMEQYFSRANTRCYVEALNLYLCGNPMN